MDNVREVPVSVEAEQAVIGGLMLSPESWPLVSDLLSDADFYRRDHALIFTAIREAAEAGKPFDVLTIGDWFESNGRMDVVGDGSYLIELASTTPSAANVKAYADIVVEVASRRRLIDFGAGLVNAGFERDGRSSVEILGEASRSIAGMMPAQSGGLRLASDSLVTWYRGFEEKFHSGSRITGLTTPWPELDSVTHGLQPQTLYIVAGRPSMGKSIVGLNLATHAAMNGKTVGFFSLEMSMNDCHARNIASTGGVSHDFVSAPDSNHMDCDLYTHKIARAIKDLKGAKLYIDDTPSLTVRQFEARARRMHQRHPLDLIVVDHIHDFRIDPKQARFEYGTIAQTIKDLGKEWNIPVVALAQLNRNVTNRTERRPTMADLRESGDIEQKGDVIILLHREDYYDTPDQKTHLQGVVEAHIAKGRGIKAGGRIMMKNSYDQMRADPWTGDLPMASANQPQRSRGMGKSSSSW